MAHNVAHGRVDTASSLPLSRLHLAHTQHPIDHFINVSKAVQQWQELKRRDQT
jgi:hypothetical protein